MRDIPVSQKAVVINGEGKLLAIRRSGTAPVGPYTWDLPGGDIEYGEDPIEGMKREIKEETGLEVVGLTPFDVEGHVYPDNGGTYWITIAYKATASGEVKLSYEHDQYQWVTKEEFLALESREKLKRFVSNVPM